MVKVSLEETLKLRAKLGRWQHKDGRHFTIKVEEGAAFGDSNIYSVMELRRPYAPYRRYRLPYKEVKALILELQKSGFQQKEFLYPELQQFFTSRGEVISDATELRDALEYTEGEVVEFESGLDAMLAMYTELENNS